MIDVSSSAFVGEVKAYGTHGRGLSPEELAEMAIPKILHVAETTCPALRDQAEQFKIRLRELLIRYMRQAITSDRTTLQNQLRRAGFAEIADVINQI